MVKQRGLKNHLIKLLRTSPATVQMQESNSYYSRSKGNYWYFNLLSREYFHIADLKNAFNKKNLSSVIQTAEVQKHLRKISPS